MPNPIEVTDIDITNVSCNSGSDGAAELTIIGGTEPYQISGQLEDLTAGPHQVTVIDSLDCSINVEFNIQYRIG